MIQAANKVALPGYIFLINILTATTTPVLQDQSRLSILGNGPNIVKAIKKLKQGRANVYNINKKSPS